MRKFFASLVMCTFAALPALANESPEKKFDVPPSGIIKVAFVISERTTLIDVVGPMQVFDQVQSPGTTGFQTFTVSENRAPRKVGTMMVVPDYTLDDAPDADIVVIPAQSTADVHYLDYLRRMAAHGKLLLSVCTGASKLAQTGLLDGKDATTHHDFIDSLQKEFPKIHFIRDRTYVHSAPMIYTAGGETSGIELALHLVELYWDHDVAVKTARYMEYRGPDWQH